MKKVPVIVLVFLSIAVKLNAQGFFVGIQGGLNNVWISNVNAQWSRIDSLKPSTHKISSANNTFRGGIGAQVGYSFNKNVAIVTELNAQHQGFKYQDSTLSKGLINAEYSASYMQIPIMIKLMAGRDGSGFFLMAGPNYSILQSATLKETDSKKSILNSDLNSKDFIAKQEIGITTVLGIQFKTSNNLLFTFGFRGNFGTKSFNKINTTIADYVNPKSKNGSVGINLGIGYHF
jgi:opacity protein-like surface antigen